MSYNASGTPDIGSGTPNIGSGTQDIGSGTQDINNGTQDTGNDDTTQEQRESRQGGEAVSTPNAVPWNRDPMDAVDDACGGP